ncbi:protein FAR1-RELATED SEQUENCE 8-like [Benincasa hispida]|uniref:protein FAR1-RELATED SEQUENCE 8-like n=1 Tax=Benincasa hispida TaxID=102211 RepID=UPI0018FF60F2|nr:protein FAR1-RELATED SEQUENCE 8-like [Benincasa hispida]
MSKNTLEGTLRLHEGKKDDRSNSYERQRGGGDTEPLELRRRRREEGCRLHEIERKMKRVGISKYGNIHTYRNEILTNDHRQASSWVLGHLISSKFEDISRSYKPKDIVKDIKQEYGVSLSYDKVWRVREEALVLVWGSPKESYKKLSKFGEALQIENSGSAFKYDLQEDKYFKHVFMALNASIRGFLNCIRPILIVGGTHLRGKYSGKLLLATGVDGNNQIYPVTFGISSGETNESWVWFLQQLICAIGQVHDVVIVSDRHPSIKKVIITVFPEAFHGICIHHLKANLLVNFKNKDILDIFDKAAKASREFVFKYH